MNILRRLLGLFIPMEEGEGEGEGEGKPNGGGDPAGRPDWCPEKFYDADQGEGVLGVRTEHVAKGYTELEGKLRDGKKSLAAEILAERKATIPEKYEIKIPEFEDGVVPEGVTVELKDDDPVAEWFMGFARETGLSQEEFNEAVSGYIKLEVAKLPDVTKEIEKLGDYGQDRMLRVTTWLEKTLKGDQLEALKSNLTNATSIEALETLMKGHTPMQFDGDGSAPGLTIDELRAMQNDPRYLGGQDKAFIKKVSDGYKRLYPG